MKKLILGLILALAVTTASAKLTEKETTFIEMISMASMLCTLELESKGKIGYLNCTVLLEMVNSPEYLNTLIGIDDKIGPKEKEYVDGLLYMFMENSQIIFRYIGETEKN